MIKKFSLTILAFSLALTGLFSQTTQAATVTWKSTDSFWNIGSNWLPVGVPGLLDDVIVSPQGGVDTYLRFDSSTGSANSLVINSDTVNTINFLQSGGSLTVTHNQIVGSTGTGSYMLSGGSHAVGILTLGQNMGSNGSYNQSAGSLSVGQEFVGTNGGVGTFTQRGGTHIVNGTLSLGSGIYNLSAGSLEANFEEIGGYFGHGDFIQTGGMNTTGILNIGGGEGSNGSYHLSAGSLSTEGLSIGSVHSSGSFTQSGGTNTVSGNLFVGGTESLGNYDLSGGSLLATNETFGGYFSHGSFTQSGGTHTVKGNLLLGWQAGSGGYSLNGGDLFATYETLSSAEGGSVLDQKGGTNTVSGVLIVGSGAVDSFFAGSANYYLSGGSLSAGSEIIGKDEGVGTFVQSNGTNAVSGSLTIGTNRGSGNYVLSGGSLSASEEFIGTGFEEGNGTGVFTQSGGTHMVDGNLYLGLAGSNGSYNLSAGSLKASYEEIGGYFGHGDFIQTGGMNTTGTLGIGGEGSNGSYNLSAGSLSTERLFIGSLHSSGSFTQSGGTNTVNGDLFAGGTESSGSYDLSGGSLLATNETFGGYFGHGSFTQSGGAHRVSGSIVLGDSFGGGHYDLSGGSLLAGSEVIGTEEGTGTFTQSGGIHTVDRMTNNGVYSLSGGTFIVNSSMENSGTMTLIGGTATMNGNVTNAASGKIEVAYSPALFTGNVVNNGQFKATDTTVTFAGTYTENGAYISDPSINNFTNLIIGTSGYLVGGTGDEWHITGSFENHSLQNALWNTANADLFFDGSGMKNLYVAGADYGLSPLGFTNNFAFESLNLASGAELNILDGNATPGAAMYVQLLNLGGGVSQLNDIHSDYNIYYNPTLAGNAYLLGSTYTLDGGGVLAPAIPEPEFYAMLLAGLGILGFAARRRKQIVHA